MASSNNDPQVKYESPYTTDPAPPLSSQSPSLKRRGSGEAECHGEKRQRVDAAPQSSANNDYLDSILAKAIADATTQFEPRHDIQDLPIASSNNSGQNGTRGQNSGYTSDPHLYMRVMSLPILESLSTQILATLAQGPYTETIKIITEPESELGQAYTTLKSLFDQTKKIYSQQAPFLSADELNILEPEHRATIRTTNLATFVSSLFGGQDVGFYELNDNFRESFTPDGAILKPELGELYLSFKTQMYLSAVQEEEQERAKEDILEDLFPDRIDEALAARYPEQSLLDKEMEFVKMVKARREYLMNQPDDIESIQALSKRFSWEDFLRSLIAHLNESYEPLIGPFMKRHSLTAPASPARPTTVRVSPNNEMSTLRSIEHDISAEAELAAQAALQSLGYGPNPSQSASQQNGGPQQQSNQSNGSNGTYHPQSRYTIANIPNNQSAPTHVLYAKARQAAQARSNPGNARKPGLPSQRRPWTTDEENALMAGLDAVKGPHWSQILAMYGPQGSVNEILKERNQVQLKDKARNLKLFFLKTDTEVPYYLQCVTGELKTRAPSQAARKEAEERAKLASEEEKARFEGIVALGGMSDHTLNGQDESHYSQASDATVTSQSPEQFHVVEPETQELPSLSQPSDDDRLRQQLMAATASSSDS